MLTPSTPHPHMGFSILNERQGVRQLCNTQAIPKCCQTWQAHQEGEAVSETERCEVSRCCLQLLSLFFCEHPLAQSTWTGYSFPLSSQFMLNTELLGQVLVF